MNRETKTITVGEHIIVMNAYITGKENKAAKAEMYKDVFATADKQEKTKFPAGSVVRMEDAQIKALIISIDGITENPFAALEAIKSSDYDEIVKAMKEAAGISLVQEAK